MEFLQLALQPFLGEDVLDAAPGGLLDRPFRALRPPLDHDQAIEVTVLLRGSPEKLVLEVEGIVIALLHSVEFLEKTMSFATNPARIGLRNIYEKRH